MYTALCFVGSLHGSHGSFTQIGDTGVFVSDAETLLLSSYARSLALGYGPFLSVLKT